MHFWRGAEVPWLSFGIFTVNKSCNQDIFHTCDNEQSSALACHFQVFSSFTTHIRDCRRKTCRDFSALFWVETKLSGQTEGFVSLLVFHPGKAFIRFLFRIPFCKQWHLKLDLNPGWERNSSQVWRFKCQSCELETEQTLALCELDANWTPELGLNIQICCFKWINLTLVAHILCKYSINAHAFKNNFFIVLLAYAQY